MPLFMLIPWVIQSAVAGVFPYPVVSETLDNGLSIAVVEMDTPGVVAYSTWMSVGSRDEIERGRTGFAHFFEHLMFMGTPTTSAAQRERTVQRLGADDNAWTWHDETVYHATLSSQQLDGWLAMEGDRFQHLTLTPDQVRQESGAVYGEFRKSQADPDQRLSEALYAEAFQVHTYHHSTLGLETDIAAMPTSHGHALAFFKAHYRPENARVIIAGDVDAAKVITDVRAAFGAWEPSATPTPDIPAEPPQEGLRSVHLDWPEPTAARLIMGWKIPAEDPDDPDTARLQLIADILLSDTGPLQRRLVREEGLAYEVNGQRGSCVDACLFQISATLKDPSTLSQVEGIIREEIASLGEGVDPSLLRRTREHERYATLTGLADPASVVSTLGWAARRGEGVDAFDRFFATYDAVTPSQISQAAKTYLVDRHLTLATLTTPTTEAAP